MTGSGNRIPRSASNWLSALAVVVVSLVVPSTAAGQVSFAGAVRGATGTYLFTERTNSAYVFLGMDAQTGRLWLSASAPLIYQSTPWVSYAVVPIPTGGPQQGTVATEMGHAGTGTGRGSPGSTVGPTVGSAGTTTPSSTSTRIVLPTESVSRNVGFGDPIVRASYRLSPTYSSTSVRVGAAFKPGLADATKGLGTGASDAGTAVSISHAIGLQQISAVVEGWWLGDMPDLELNTTLSYRIAYDRFLWENRWLVSAAFGGWTTIVDGAEPPRDISAGLTRYFGGARRSLGMTASFGLSDVSPDFTIGADWRIRF